MKKIAFLGIAILLAVGVGVRADTVSPATVRLAVNNWLAQEAQLGCAITGAVSSVRLCTTTDGASFYVARLSGGGFVVTAAETEIDPIIAFSSEKDLVEDDRNPLWALLVRDLAERKHAVMSVAGATGSGGAGTVRTAAKLATASAVGSTSATAPATRWSRLTAAGSGAGAAGTRTAAMAASGGALSKVSDVRVSPFLKTKWGQSTDASGARCYNYYTPKHYLCGCTATAGAQLLRYHKFPSQAVEPKSYWVEVDGEEVELTQMGGLYDWNNMPYAPGSKTTAYQRQAIGKLTYDVSLAVGSSFGKTETWGYFDLFTELCLEWGYAHVGCLYVDEEYGVDADQISSIIIPNLDARLPVGVRIYGKSDAHFVLADGYGFSDGLLGVHLNFGWDGDSDAWYVLPGTYYTSRYKAVSHLYGNIYPYGPSEGSIVSGRALNATTAKPVAGVVVRAENGDGDIRYAVSDAKGVYALILACGDWEIVPANAESSTSYTLSVYDTENYYEPNNVYDQDFDVASVTCEAGARLDAPAVRGRLTDDAFASSEITLTSGDDGVKVRYLNFILPAGSVSTFAVPQSFTDAGGTFRVLVGVDGEEMGLDDVYAFDDGTLSYRLVNLENYGDEMPVTVCLSTTASSGKVSLYAGLGNHMPPGSPENTHEVTGDIGTVTWTGSTDATLLAGTCWFSLYAEPGITYAFEACGIAGIRAEAGTLTYADDGIPGLSSLDGLSHTYGPLSDRLSFTVDRSRWVYLRVSASVAAGSFTATSTWTNDDVLEVRTLLGVSDLITASGYYGDDSDAFIATGNGGWRVDGETVRSGTFDAGDVSVMLAHIAGIGTLSFDWKSSCQDGPNILSFFLDDSLVDSLRGVRDWTNVVAQVTGTGSHTLEWIFVRTGGSSSSSEYGSVRNFTWTPILYTAVLDANGGACDVASVHLAGGVAVGDDLPVATREGYDFLGWYTAASGGARITSETLMMADTTWYAQWGEIRTVIAGAAYSVNLGLAGYKAKGLPSGLKFDAKKGVVSGTVKTALGQVLTTFSKAGQPDRVVAFVVRKENAPSVACVGLEGVTLVQGVQCGSPNLPLTIDAESGIKSMTATKLPTGVKLVCSKDKKTYFLSGVPTVPGTYAVSLALTTAASTKVTKSYTVTVVAMASGAVGTFGGFVQRSDASTGETLNVGSLLVTVGEVGKISAKVVSTTSYSFSATGWDCITDGVYRVTMATAKGDALTLSCAADASWTERQMSGTFRAVTGTLAGETLSVDAQRNAFGTKWFFTATGDDTKGWLLQFADTSKAADLTVTLTADGKTSVAGTLGGNKVSASGYADVSGIAKGAVFADFAPVITVNKKKRSLSLRTNLWFDRKNDHAEGVGTAVFVP